MSITYLHSANCGDLLSVLPGVRQYWMDSKQKGVIYQRLGMKAHYYPGAVHPVLNEQNEMVTFNSQMFAMMGPLLKYQEYIEDFIEWEGEKVVVNLEKIRGECFVNMPYGEIKRWIFYAFPDLATDLSQKWLSVPPLEDERTKGKIICNFTERYRNELITYYFLKEFQEHIVFTGTQQEHELFNTRWKLDVPYLKVNDFLELAVAINSCRFFMGNQSMQFQIAEGLKAPRIVEACQYAPNVTPNGPNGYDFYHQGAVEYYVNKLFKEFP